MSGIQDTSQTSFSEMQLPPQFESIQDILDIKTERLRSGPFVSVIGFVRDYLPPVKTKGSDFLCTLHILDISTQFRNGGIRMVIFWPEERMPKISGSLDVVLARKVKVQMYQGSISLLANVASEFHVISGSKIPTSPSLVSEAVWLSVPGGVKSPCLSETEYIVWANHHMDKSLFPSSEVFKENSRQAMNVKEKFSLLKDVKPNQFYDVMGEVIKVFEKNGFITMYISDYTANSLFYNYAWAQETSSSEGCDGDEYGYMQHRPKSAQDWPGPYGKVVIQITIFDRNADFVRENVKEHQWVLLSNVQISFGKAGGCLEGYLRTDRNRVETRIRVQIMKRADDPDRNDVRWKEGVARKCQWWGKFKQQKKELEEEEAGSANKRKRDTEHLSKGTNSKGRRKEKRAAAEEKVAAGKRKDAKVLDLNENIRCNHSNKTTSLISEISKYHVTTSSDGYEHSLPFVNGNYRANVRVVDFFPDQLEDFAIGRRITDYDILSNYSGSEDTDQEEDLQHFKDGKGFVEKTWEWRFALQVEDATVTPSSFPSTSSDRIWLVVDNEAAQMLLNIPENATNLRTNHEVLNELREKLCILWGDLEEHKSTQTALIRQQLGTDNNQTPTSSLDTTTSVSLIRRAGDQPDLDSDIENDYQESKRKERSLPLRDSAAKVDSTSRPKTPSDQTMSHNGSGIKNKAFSCCIKQYGIKVSANNSTEVTAKNSKNWERKFGLFGTQIS